MAPRLSICLAAFWWVSCLVPSVRAADDAYPQSLLGFIKPGMHLGVSYEQSSSLVMIEILTDKQVQIWMESREKTLKDLGQKRPNAADIEMQKFLARTTYVCTVLHVGDDYILTTLGGARKQAIAAGFVSRVICEFTEDSKVP